MNWENVRKIVFIFFITSLVIGALSYYIWGDEISLSEIQNITRSFGIWAPTVFLFLFVVGSIFIPSTPLMALSGILFGLKYGFIYSIIGATISSIITFYIGRFFGKVWAESILEKKYLSKINEYNKKLEHGAIWDLIIFRNIPIMPFNVLNILMSISRIKSSDYIIGTVIGLIPSNFLSVYIGTVITKFF
jgi:uncharacterized membrane protein YdjX (TVP38/TMEM64 family)